MAENIYYQYYVEGEDEKSILRVLRTDLRCIQPGKIEKFNAVQNQLSLGRMRTMRSGTIVIFVYDTDVGQIACSNLDTRLKKCGFSMEKFWSRIPENDFQVFGNDADKIRMF